MQGKDRIGALPMITEAGISPCIADSREMVAMINRSQSIEIPPLLETVGIKMSLKVGDLTNHKGIETTILMRKDHLTGTRSHEIADQATGKNPMSMVLRTKLSAMKRNPPANPTDF